MEGQENLQERYDKVRQFRDELKVQLNLGKMQVRDAWEEVEKDFHKLEGKMKDLRERGGEEAEKMREQARTQLKSIRERFEKLRAQI